MLGVGRGGPCGRDEPDEVGGPSPARDDPRSATPSSWPAAGLDDAERDAWVVLNEVPGVGPVSFARLLAAHSTARAVLALALRRGGPAALVAATADPDGGSSSLSLSAAGLIADAAADPDGILGAVRRAGVAVLTLADPQYPGRLRQIALPPPVLFVRGDAASMSRARAVAVVGTRRPTEVGRGTASRIAEAVAGLGATIVSGLALGIDASAHAAAVRGGNPTVAVIGGGHARLYPAGNRRLAEQIVAGGGAVISEFAPDTVPTRGTFPRRNRIISGLADATVVVEAGVRSGALTTAAWALEQGRGLHIVPGRMDDPAVAGSLAFLREAGPEVRIVAGIPELLEDLGLLRAWVDAATAEAGGRSTPAGLAVRAVLASLPAVERSLAILVLEGRGSVDELVAATALGSATVLGALTALELRGLVAEAFGRYRPIGVLAGAGRRKPVPRTRPVGTSPGGIAPGDAGSGRAA
jgi:DNA processing protein